MKTNSVFKNDTQFFELKIKINNHVVAVFNLNTFLTRNRELSLSISYLFHIVTFSRNQMAKKTKSTLFQCQWIQHESTNWGHYFSLSNWRRDSQFMWSSEPHEGLVACSAKGVPSFLSYFKTLSFGPAPDLPLCSNTLYWLS